MRINFKVVSLSIMLSTNIVTAGSNNLIDSGNDLYSIQVTINNSIMDTKQFGYNTAEALFDAIESVNLASEFSNYVETSIVESNINYRGVALSLSYLDMSSDLTLNIPDLGFSKTFSGATRDDSSDLLFDYFEDNNDILNRLNKLLTQKSPTDPIAGNPNSLMGGMVDSAFRTGASIKKADNNINNVKAENETGNVLSTGIRFGKFRQGGKNVISYTLPIEYEFKNSNGKDIYVNVPISYLESNGAKSYKIGLDLAMKIPMNKKWSLTPGIGYGLVGSKDLVSSGQIGSLSLSSLYKLDKSIAGNDNLTLNIANMVGYYKTFPIKLAGVNIDPNITNTVVRNGLIADYKTEVFGVKSNIQTYLTDTRFFGDKLYAEHYNEVGIYVAPEDKTGINKYLGINASYLFGNNDISGFSVSLSYNF